MLKENKERWELLHRFLNLEYPPVAMKLIEDASEVPENAVSPRRDMGGHIALCQAFALSRRQGKTVYMEKQDHWCWNPLITYGMVECKRGTPAFQTISSTMGISDPDKADDFVDAFPKLPYGKYCGILTAPLDKADYEPDILLIYCGNSQLRVLLMGIVSKTGKMLDSSFTPLDSCVYSVVPPFQNGDYRITIPDPGEYERALTDKNDIILTVPHQRMEEFFSGVGEKDARGVSWRSFYPSMKEDFSRPPFYNRLFAEWGLDTGKDWEK